MLIGMILWPLLSRRHDIKKREEKEKIWRERMHGQNDFLKLWLGLGNLPFQALFVLDQKLAGKAHINELMNLPMDCSLVVETGCNLSKIFDRDDISGNFVAFQPEFYLKQDEQELAVSLANLQLDSASANYSLPGMLTFLEMFGVGKIEHLNAFSRWKENDPTLTLETPIGVCSIGELFQMDLHEKFQGPHGLIVGMTGPGKSEFIMTYVLSLAVNDHPMRLPSF